LLVLARVANWCITVFRTGDPALSKGTAESLVRSPLVFFATVWTLDHEWIDLDRFPVNVVVALIGIAVLADVSPHLFFESVAVDTFDRGIVIPKDISNWCIEMIVPRPNNRSILATLPTLRLPLQQLVGINREHID
jgi:hypothetical protein